MPLENLSVTAKVPAAIGCGFTLTAKEFRWMWLR